MDKVLNKTLNVMLSVFVMLNHDERKRTFVKQHFLVLFLVQKEIPVKALLEAKKCIFSGKIKESNHPKRRKRVDFITNIENYVLLSKKSLRINMEKIFHVCYNAKHGG